MDGNDNAHKVLIVDDEENVAYIAATALRLDGWETTTAASGSEALALIEPFGPDVIVLDVMLPDSDGYQVCRQIRAGGCTTPVIFLSARRETADRVRGLTIGGDDYLTKPFSVEELVARCRSLARRTGSGRSQVLSYADLEMDENAHRVSRGGERIHLSPTEYKLLRYLLLNAERVLSRAQILDRVWDYDFGGDSSNIDSYISFLRRKIDTTEPKLIQTVRGVGYVLRDDSVVR